MDQKAFIAHHETSSVKHWQPQGAELTKLSITTSPVFVTQLSQSEESDQKEYPPNSPEDCHGGRKRKKTT